MAIETEINPNTPYSKIVDYEEVRNLVNNIQKNGMKVVLTTGVYDLFHYKHAESLACISLLGNFTVVGIPGDLEVSLAGSQGIQTKDRKGPVVDFEKRAKTVAHLPYVDLIFKKTSNKLDLITKIQPDILAQSITSGVHVVNEILELINYIPSDNNGHGNLVFNLHEKLCEVIFIDDIINGHSSVIEYTNAIEKAKLWEVNKFSDDKFHGSSIKKEIIRRSTENK